MRGIIQPDYMSVIRILAYQQMQIKQIVEMMRRENGKNDKNSETEWPEKKYLKFEEAMHFFGVSETKLREMAYDAEAVSKVGRLVWIDVGAMNDFLDSARV